MFLEFIRDKAAAEIEILLANGEMKSKDVHALLAKQGYSKNTVSRAATLAGVTSFKKPGVVGSWWRIDD